VKSKELMSRKPSYKNDIKYFCGNHLGNQRVEGKHGNYRRGTWNLVINIAGKKKNVTVNTVNHFFKEKNPRQSQVRCSSASIGVKVSSEPAKYSYLFRRNKHQVLQKNKDRQKILTTNFRLGHVGCIWCCWTMIFN